MAKCRQFYQLGPVCYRVSLWKEGLRKSLADRQSGFRAAELRQEESLPVIVKSHRSPVLRRLEGVDMALQQSKRANLALAAGRIDGVVIRPGESFSFWRLVGDPTARRGFGPGLTIASGRVGTGVGGGLCQAGNLIHYLVLHSPLTVTELHHHSDALFPDDRRRVPFGTGTPSFILTLTTASAMTPASRSSCGCGWRRTTCAASCAARPPSHCATACGRRTATT